MSPEKVKLLLVDDSELMLGYLADLLRKSGYEVFAARNLVDSVGLYGRHRPSVVLSDFVLGANQTGLEVISAIFALNEASRPTAAILTQGALSPMDQKRAEFLSVRVLQKPKRGHEQQFVEEVAEWITLRQGLGGTK